MSDMKAFCMSSTLEMSNVYIANWKFDIPLNNLECEDD